VSAISIEQRSLGTWFLDHHPDLAALYAQINHFNPSAHRTSPKEWREALLRLNEPVALTAMPALRGLACPTLFIVGRDDPIVPVSAMQDVARFVARSEVVVIDNAAHSAYFEQPAAFNGFVLAFLERCVDSSRSGLVAVRE
jgi:3-oxoadipate enol-lactonase